MIKGVIAFGGIHTGLDRALTAYWLWKCGAILPTRQLLREYLGGNEADINKIMSRGETIYTITQEWFRQVEQF